MNIRLATIAGATATRSHSVTASMLSPAVGAGRSIMTSTSPICDRAAVMAAAGNISRQFLSRNRQACVKQSMTGTRPPVCCFGVSNMPIS